MLLPASLSDLMRLSAYDGCPKLRIVETRCPDSGVGSDKVSIGWGIIPGSRRLSVIRDAIIEHILVGSVKFRTLSRSEREPLTLQLTVYQPFAGGAGHSG